MNHDDARRLISERLDRQLTPAEAADLATHLTHCPNCARFERRLAAGTRQLASLPSVPANPRVRERVMGEIAPAAGRRRWLGQGLRLAGAMAAFALVGAVLVAVLRDSGAGTPGDSDRQVSGAGSTISPTRLSIPTPSVVPFSAPCATGQVELQVTIAPLANDAVRITIAAIKATGGAYCHLTTDVTLTVFGSDEQPLGVEGNGSSLALDAEIPSDAARVDFVWLNWCGAPGPHALQATAADGTQARATEITPPPCTDATQPSKLGPLATTTPSLALCTLQQYSVEFDGSTAAAGSVYLALKAVNLGVPCHLATDLTVTLTDSSLQPLDIQGNSVALHLEGDLPGAVTSGVVWANWCGETDDMSIEIDDSGGGSSGSGPVAVPGCNAPDQPSTLRAMTPDELGPIATATPSTAPPLCDLGGYELDPRVEGAAGTRYIAVSASYVGTPCVFKDELTLTIKGSDGLPLDIQGNGALASDSIDLSAGTRDVAAFAWTNWCGDDGPFDIEVQTRGLTAETSLNDGPPCNAPGEPSMLTALQPSAVASPTSGTPECLPGQLQFTQEIGDEAGSTSITITIARYPAEPLCHVNNGLSLIINGTVADTPVTDGTFAVADLDADVTDAGLRVTFLWSNWCGDPGPFPARGKWSLGGLEFQIDQIPACNIPDQPATLTVVETDGVRAIAEPVEPTPSPTPLAALRECGPDDFSLEIGVQGFTQKLGISVHAFSTNEPCHLRVNIALTIVDGDGQPLDIQGNGSSATLDANLPSEEADVSWAWGSNWCGNATDIQFVATAADQSTSIPAPNTPPCNAPDQPSTLTFLPRE